MRQTLDDVKHPSRKHSKFSHWLKGCFQGGIVVLENDESIAGVKVNRLQSCFERKEFDFQSFVLVLIEEEEE